MSRSKGAVAVFAAHPDIPEEERKGEIIKRREKRREEREREI